MDYNFFAQFAPELGVTNPNQGMAPSEQPQYDASGMPRAYIQDVGGPRMYQGIDYGTPDGLRGRTNDWQGTAPTGPMSDAGEGMELQALLGPTENFAPQNLIGSIPGEPSTMPRQPTAPVGPGGTRVIMPIPRGAGNMEGADSPILRGIERRGMEQRRREEPAVRPIQGDSHQGGIEHGRRLQEELQPRPNQEAARPGQMPGSLGELLSMFNYRIGSQNGGTPADGLRGRNGGGQNDSELLPSVDVRVDYPPTTTGDVQQVGQRFASGRAEEVATYLRSRGIRINSVTRRGNARSRGHPMGNSLDVHPDDAIMAENLIRSAFPGLAVEAIHVADGQDFGGGVVSTGEHVHFDLGAAAQPRRRPRTRTSRAQ